MSQFFTLAVAAMLLCIATVHAQMEQMKHSCMHGKTPARKTTIADTAEDNYDVKLDLNVTNTSTDISGSASTTAIVTSDSLSAYVFELSDILTIDSVKVNGILRSVSHSGDVHYVSITPALRRNTAFTAVVYYYGTPASGSLFTFPSGMNSYAAAD